MPTTEVLNLTADVSRITEFLANTVEPIANLSKLSPEEILKLVESATSRAVHETVEGDGGFIVVFDIPKDAKLALLKALL